MRLGGPQSRPYPLISHRGCVSRFRVSCYTELFFLECVPRATPLDPLWKEGLFWMQNALLCKKVEHCSAGPWRCLSLKPSSNQQMKQCFRSWDRLQTPIITVIVMMIATNLYWWPFQAFVKSLTSVILCVPVCMLSCFSHVWLFATLWTVAHQAPLSMGLSRQEYWNGLPCPPPVDLPNPGVEPISLTSPVLASRFFTTGSTWEV